MNRLTLLRLTSAAAALALMMPLSAAADAGKAIFVFGKAHVVSANGAKAVLEKGSVVDSGDTIVTSSNGRVQVQMADGGLIALRPSTEFKIEDFNYPKAGSAFVADEPRSFFALVKGGFRSITGAVGKENKAAYRVRTPVATIGIRGTDYDAMYCAADCGALERVLGQKLNDGLYVGVNSGGVRVATEGGSLDLDMGEYGFAASSDALPTRSDVARRVLSPAVAAALNEERGDEADTSLVANPDSGSTGESNAGERVDFNVGDAVAAKPKGAVSYANVPSAGSGVVAADSAAPVRDANGALVGFDVNGDSISVESSTVTNVGRDADRTGATGLSWGRWDGGTVTVINEDGSSEQQVLGSSHWVAGPEDAASPTLPTTGSANFELIGNTDPTDNAGNVGTLGSASLEADFTNQTVDADVSLSFEDTNTVWDASAQDVDINSDATFDGEFDTVTVTDGAGQTVDGSGDLGGFFTGDENGVTGAGMSYTLDDNGSTTVSGSAAFQTSDPDGP